MKSEKITNKHYKQFLEENIIQILNEKDINKALNNVKGKHRQEGRAFIIILYYTGARPNELLQLKAKDLEKDNTYLKIQIPASKRGLPRPVHLKIDLPLVKELYQYTRGIYDEMLLFYHLKNNYKRTKISKRTGAIKQYTETTDKLRYYFKIWFKGILEEAIPPYYLRHNRFSKQMIAGATPEEIRIMKGSKTLNSVTPYLHMSTKASKKMAKTIN